MNSHCGSFRSVVQHLYEATKISFNLLDSEQNSDLFTRNTGSIVRSRYNLAQNVFEDGLEATNSI